MRLSSSSISESALRICDAYGLADVTMRRVAATLDVAPGALYWHVKSKQELIALMAQLIISPTLSHAHEDPRELAHALRRAVLAHRDGAEVVMSAVSQPNSRVREDLMNAVRASLGSGTDANTAIRDAAAAGVVYLTLGAAAVHQSTLQLREATSDGGSLDGHCGDHCDDETANEREALQGIDLLLNGLEHTPR
ncbi:TetR family transcriptional regulator [Corynebacterium aquatimens]|uniref:AcrR family transcriptional regulator n=1 Tax=Corynebacterium aquatimens TaxID=1190508 RepID=A0A931E297_9CORY|nr:TetR family transcriptional regulator [Corynebacterium aquatimens]MBG6121931.1 AcrR family transcriptional regulator [Corynebacterium aquatimens]WJY65531.1 Tetracycline repressor protein class B [Corynebacterium aquatimens]